VVELKYKDHYLGEGYPDLLGMYIRISILATGWELLYTNHRVRHSIFVTTCFRQRAVGCQFLIGELSTHSSGANAINE
jgi:hypothetical protein